MGCDIHCYIEYKEKNRWLTFGSRINPGRNYLIFALLANVRNYDITPLFYPRGLPEDVSFITSGDNKLFVRDGDDFEEDCCNRKQAEKWVSYGASEYTDESKNFVTHPDHHSHSWATPAELAKVLYQGERLLKNEFGFVEGKFDLPEWYMVESILDTFEEWGYESRLVFWFDN